MYCAKATGESSKLLTAYSGALLVRAVLLVLLWGTFPQPCFSLPPESNAQAGVERRLLFGSLFPVGTLRTYSGLWGGEEVSEVLVGLSLRGMKGFVPVREAIRLQLSDHLGAIAFPIYLHPASEAQEKLITTVPRFDPARRKLTQFLFYAPETNRFLAKPDGFPLVSTGWSCNGDLCDHVSIIGLERIVDSSSALVLKYTQGVSARMFRIIVFSDGGAVSSEPFAYGDLGGDSGYEASVQYHDWVRQRDAVTARVDTRCEQSEPEFCRSIGLEPGRQSKRKVIYRLDNN